MRQILLAILLSIMLFIKAQCQFSSGISASIQHTNISNLAGYERYTKFSPRLEVTLIAQYEIKDKLVLSSGLGYSLYSQNSNVLKNDFHFVSLPLFIKFYKPFKENNIALVRYFGLNYQYLISATHKIGDEKENILKYSNRNHWELEFGTGIKNQSKNGIKYEFLIYGKIGTEINKISVTSTYYNNVNLGIKFNVFLIKNDCEF